MNETLNATTTLPEPLTQLALHGGSPVRHEPLPLEFPGAYFYGDEELANVTEVVKAHRPFRYKSFSMSTA